MTNTNVEVCPLDEGGRAAKDSPRMEFEERGSECSFSVISDISIPLVLHGGKGGEKINEVRGKAERYQLPVF